MNPLVLSIKATPLIVANTVGLADFKAKSFTPTETVELPEASEFAIKIDKDHANEHFVDSEILLANEVNITKSKETIHAAILFTQTDYALGAVSITNEQATFTPFNKEHPVIKVTESSTMKLAEIIVSKRA
jgi:hypothetical protein